MKEKIWAILKGRMLSFKFAFTGLFDLLKGEINFQIHLACFAIVLGLGFSFSINHYEWAILLIVSSIVIVSEALNTSIEYVVDLVSPNYHKIAKKAKDVSAAAALLAAIFAAIIGIIIFYPYFMSMIS